MGEYTEKTTDHPGQNRTADDVLTTDTDRTGDTGYAPGHADRTPGRDSCQRRMKTMKHSDPCDFAHLLQESTRPTAFPFALPDTYAIPVIQTHASAVLLTPELVYKLKKPRNFGFFDYSTSTLRRHFCQQEVAVNQLLAPGIYLGVAPVLLSRDGHVHFGATY